MIWIHAGVVSASIGCWWCSGAVAQTIGPARAYPAQIAAAEKSLQLDDPRELRRWLDVTSPSERGWEWEYLNAVADTTQRKVETPDAPVRIAISPGGDIVATVEGALVRLWSWPALEPLRTIEGHRDAVYRAEFSPDGLRLVTVSRDVTSQVWDVASGKSIAGIELSNPAFAAATFSPDGTRVATCAWERDDTGVHGVVWVWDATTSEVLHRNRVGVKPLSAIHFTPDGEQILVGSWDGVVHLLAADATETSHFTLADDGVYNAVNDIGISPDGALVAAASKDRTTSIFSIDSGELVARLSGHQGYVESAVFSHDGKQLVTSSVDTSVRVWCTDSWRQTAVLRGATETTRGAIWSPDDAEIIACSLESRLLVWNSARSVANQTTIATGASGTYSCVMTPDGSTMAVACYDGWLRLFDTRSGELVDSWEAHAGSTCHAAQFSADGLRLATCSWDNHVRVWNVASHKQIAALDAGDGVYDCSISPDGTRAAGSGSTLKVWNVDAGELLFTAMADGTEPTRITFSHDGKLIASGWDDGTARVHDAATGRLVAQFGDSSSRVETVGFTEDDSRLITGDSAGVVRVYPAGGGQAIHTCDTGGRGISRVEVSGHRIAIAADQLWMMDLDRGDIVLGLKPLADTIWNLAWSPDGRRLATCPTQGTIVILGAGQ